MKIFTLRPRQNFLKKALAILFFSALFITANAQSVNWAFLKGYGNLPEYPTYGTQGVAAAANTPGARQGSVSWESGGKLYLFGGSGYAASGSGSLNDLWEYDTATGNWRWLKGSGSGNQQGTYGTQGTAAAANTPGARYNSVSWMSNGKLYVFGGYGYAASGSGFLNDLWEYDTTTGNWRWIKGSSSVEQTGTYGTQGTAAAANTPGARYYSVSWESSGKLYLFGGYGYAASGYGQLNDLWEYDTATGNWRWLKGSNAVNQTGTYGTLGTPAAANAPGARQQSVSWVSSGKLYLFGGNGYAASINGQLNDLWEYDTATGNWRWLKGSNANGQYGTYGTQGTAAAGNTPGARYSSVSWVSSGKLYLFGGYGYATNTQGNLNDLWEYDTATGNWHWMKGSSIDQTGTYGTQGTAASTNTPGARQSSVSWESGGKLYLFGGYGYAASGYGYRNDLWEYETATGNWRWLKGSNLTNQQGTYGTQGTAAAANTPGARQNAVSWGSGGKLYLFGGYGYDASGSGYLNDLWEYDITTGNWRWLEGSSTAQQQGTYGTQGTAAAANTLGGRNSSVSWASGGKLYLFGGNGHAASGSGFLNDLWEYDTTTGNWRWLEGSSTANQQGTYGTQGTAAIANTPGGRHSSVSWESGGKLYLFGGNGYAESGSGELNDLWEYDTATGNWRWVKGNKYSGDVGTSGTQGLAAPANSPRSRYASAGWESGGKLYLFGGYYNNDYYSYYYTYYDNGRFNDLWEFDTATGNWRWINGRFTKMNKAATGHRARRQLQMCLGHGIIRQVG